VIDTVINECEIEWFKGQLRITVEDDAAILDSRHHTRRVELRPGRWRVDTASVPGPVCESEKCLEERPAGASHLLTTLRSTASPGLL
jgi:hypothetical protein